MTSTTFEKQMRLLAISCGLGASLPVAALAQQAQSPVCAQASLYHSTHNKKAAAYDRLCAAEHAAAVRRNQASGNPAAANQAAANQAAARQAMLDKRRQEVLEQRRQQDEQQRREQQQQQQQSLRSSRSNPGSSNPMDRFRAEQQRRLALQRQRMYQQNQGYYVPVAVPAPAPAPYAVAAPPAAPPPPSGVSGIAPVNSPNPSDLSAGTPSGPDLLAPGPRNASLQSDQANAKKAKVDLNVFGLTLGDPVTRPHCAQLAAQGSNSCVADDGFPALVAGMFNARVAKLNGFNNVPVQLPDSQCPDWLKAGSCTVVLAMKDGYPYAAFMVAGGEDQQSNIETLLNQKYAKAADKSQLSPCKKDHGSAPRQSPVRVWSLHGLQVAYDPVAARCASPGWRYGSGQIVVETDTFRHLTRDAEQPHDANQAKM